MTPTLKETSTDSTPAMECLGPHLVAAVKAGMSGKRLQKFTEAVMHLNASLAQGGWLKGGNRKVSPGFYQGCGIRLGENFNDHAPGCKGRSRYYLVMAITYGQGYEPEEFEDAIEAIPSITERTREFARAWVALCLEKDKACAYLDSLRPLPAITAIGLSPKVTKTLKEMDLNVDIASIKPAKVVWKRVPVFPPRLDEDGDPVLEICSYIEWTPGTKFGRSRFSHGGGCEACGKQIPSCLFVPIEAHDTASGDNLGLWLGIDCARNIFGVKDIGTARS